MAPELAYFLKVNVAFILLYALSVVLLQGHLLQIAPCYPFGILWGVIVLSVDEYSELDTGTGADGRGHTNVFGYFA